MPMTVHTVSLSLAFFSCLSEDAVALEAGTSA